jgi:DNA-binding transcriptional LysR family regulator
VVARFASEVNDVHTLLDLVLHGLGVAVVPAHIARKKATRLACVPLPAGAPTWDVTIALPKAGTSAASRAFFSWHRFAVASTNEP